MREPPPAVRIASYNVHECVGVDRSRDPDRVAHVIREMDADLVGLQEVHSRSGGKPGAHQLEHLAGEAGFPVAVAGTTMRRRGGEYGNALLSRHPVRAIRRHDLSYGRYEPRGALDLEVEVHGRALRAVITHLGLRPAERRHQVGRLLEILSQNWIEPLVFLGDVNEWLPSGRALRWLHRALGKPAGRRTFPSRLPLFALDRIWVRPHRALLSVRAHDTPLSRRASDHLPLVAAVGLSMAHGRRGEDVTR